MLRGLAFFFIVKMSKICLNLGICSKSLYLFRTFFSNKLEKFDYAKGVKAFLQRCINYIKNNRET